MFSKEIGVQIIKSIYETPKTNNNESLMTYSEKMLEAIDTKSEAK
jgi:hypothetical protein